MRNSILTGLLAFAAAGSLTACDSFVQDVDGPIDRVVSDSLNQPAQVDFLITGVKEGFNDSYDAVAVVADLLSDAALFDTNVENATFPTFRDIDNGAVLPDNNSIDGVYGAINEYRFLADDLLDRVTNQITFDAGEEAIRDRGVYAANFHGAIARYMLGSYFGTDNTTGGAPISDDPDNPSPPIPTAELYAQALAKLDAAAAVSPGAYETRLINTIKARIALFAGNTAQAGQFAANGLIATDDPYTGNYASTSTNNWWSQGGRGRTQVAVADRFFAYDQIDDRSLTEEAPTVAGVTQTYYRQALYLLNSDPIPFASWQEANLIRAEAALAAGDAGTARTLIDAVRASHGIAPLAASPTQQTIIDERDRELFTRGLRLIDQRRFGIPIPNNQQFFPLTQTERNANPNV